MESLRYIECTLVCNISYYRPEQKGLWRYDRKFEWNDAGVCLREPGLRASQVERVETSEILTQSEEGNYIIIFLFRNMCYILHVLVRPTISEI